MKKLFVYADFDWFKAPEQIGCLTYEQKRGNDSYSFAFAPDWLRHHPDLVLSDDLRNFTGVQYTQPNRDVFACFMDALPDRWGRLLLHRREQNRALQENRAIQRLSSFDYLMGIDDFSRMGAFRFKEQEDGTFINTEDTFRTPPLTSLAALQHACDEVEKAEIEHILPEDKWLLQLLQPGSSLGGARPKASVLDEKQNLCIAKFPSRNDDYDVELWEHCCSLLAAQAGIHVADTRVIQPLGAYHTLLSQRFDRTADGKRVHFASALTLLGLTDGDNAQSGHGYLDIVDFILQSCTNVEQNLRELYRRVAFNICIHNTDDHFRNHGFLLTPKGWTLSPAYDINPTQNHYHALLISADSNESDLRVLQQAASDYMLDGQTAQQIINEVQAAVAHGPALAARLGLPKHEIGMFMRI